MVLNYVYRLLPRKSQHRALEAILESQRQLYNAALEERIDAYRKAGVTRNYAAQTKALTEWRQTDPEASALPANLQRFTLKRLDNAYRAFFRRVKSGQKPGFPRFRGKGWFNTFGFREFSGISLARGFLKFQGIPGPLRIHFHRPLPEKLVPKSCFFKRQEKGWIVGFAIEVATDSLRHGSQTIGVDLGITALVTLSDGTVFPGLHAARRAERRLRAAQRRLCRRRLGSGGRRKARAALRRCHAAVRQRRATHLHQISASLVRRYDVIALEALQIDSLARSILAKSVRDASWGLLVSMLRYKAAKAGARLIEVDPRNTSRDCSGCGAPVEKELGERWHSCPHCGLSIDRDVNAARNVLHRAVGGPGLPNVAGFGMRAGGNRGADEAS